MLDLHTSTLLPFITLDVLILPAYSFNFVLIYPVRLSAFIYRHFEKKTRICCASIQLHRCVCACVYVHVCVQVLCMCVCVCKCCLYVFVCVWACVHVCTCVFLWPCLFFLFIGQNFWSSNLQKGQRGIPTSAITWSMQAPHPWRANLSLLSAQAALTLCFFSPFTPPALQLSAQQLQRAMQRLSAENDSLAALVSSMQSVPSTPRLQWLIGLDYNDQ